MTGCPGTVCLIKIPFKPEVYHVRNGVRVRCQVLPEVAQRGITLNPRIAVDPVAAILPVAVTPVQIEVPGAVIQSDITIVPPLIAGVCCYASV